jgi:microcin C transport system permease protein
MLAYIARRLLLIIPTLFGILVINFFIIQAAPGGPVEQAIAKSQGIGGMNIGGSSGAGDVAVSRSPVTYRGAQGLPPEIVELIKKQYGFDKPVGERFRIMVSSYLRFDFGNSLFRDKSVLGLIAEKLPVSISIGLWSTLIIYFISIPLGIRKAVHSGTPFDAWTGMAISVGYAIPAFLLAILLIVLFAGGSYWHWFPMQGLTSEDVETLTWWGKIKDYGWHMVLPTICLSLSGFATLTMLTRNSFLDEINKQYVMTARAKGLTESRVLYGHVFRNAMLLVIAGIPSLLVGLLFTGAFLIENIFNLDGMGLLGFQSVLTRDYPVIFGVLYMSTLIGLTLRIVSDIAYTLVDPRIDFEDRGQ